MFLKIDEEELNSIITLGSTAGGLKSRVRFVVDESEVDDRLKCVGDGTHNYIVCPDKYHYYDCLGVSDNNCF